MDQKKIPIKEDPLQQSHNLNINIYIPKNIWNIRNKN
jgi:hypothetical protein